MKFKIILISTMLLLLGCSLINGPNKTTPISFENYSYPLEVGNSWTYERTTTYSNIRPDTVQLPIPLIQKGSAIIEVTGIDTLGTDNEVFVFHTGAIDSMNPQTTHTGTFYFKNEEDGMYNYIGTGNSYALPISQPATRGEFEQRYFNKKEKDKFSISILNSEIRKSLQYPIKLNDEWTFIDSTGNIFGINKKIFKYEKVSTKMGTYNCFIVEWIYDNGSNLILRDYYSTIGLMKRIYIIKNIQVSDYNNNRFVTADFTDEYNLVEFVAAPKLP